MTTQLACLQDFAKRDAEDVRVKLGVQGKRIEGTPSSRDWILAFSIHKAQKGMLERIFTGKVRNNFPAATARVDFGRWVAECPFCGKSCMVDPDDPIFFCLYCACNGTGDACPCTFPTDKDDIETELLTRKVVVIGASPSKADEAKDAAPLYHGLARNWNPGETVADLHKQKIDIESMYGEAVN